MRVFLCAFLSAIALMVGGCNEGSSTAPADPPPITQPTPAPQQRTDLLYGYYGNWDGQVAATADHTNLGWAGPQWGNGGDKRPFANAINRLRELRDSGNRCVVLDVLQVYDPEPEPAIRAYFNALQGEGLIGSYICALYPADEPDGAGKSAEEIVSANALLRRVARDYGFIPNIPLFTIYTCHHGYPGVESVDWASVDDYASGAGVIEKCVKPLKAKLRPTQRLLLTPGGFQCDAIQPFLDYADRDPQVLGITTFIWFANWGGKSEQGVENAPCRASYVAAGRAIKGG